MLKTARSRIFLLAACLAAAFIWFAFFSGEEGGPPPSKNATSPETADDSGDAERSALDLALKNIILSQGEGGFEVWRLKAEWANMQKEEGRISVTLPRLTYYMRDDGNTIQVRSETGDIDQKEQILRFVGQVHATQEDKELTGELLIYDGKEKTMSMPEGGDFVADGSKGRADAVVWNIDAKLITATGNVRVDMSSPPPPEDAGRNSASSPDEKGGEKGSRKK